MGVREAVKLCVTSDLGKAESSTLQASDHRIYCSEMSLFLGESGCFFSGDFKLFNCKMNKGNISSEILVVKDCFTLSIMQ